MSFQKWAPGQPDNYNEEENCVEAVFNSKIEGWNDVSCLKGRHFICEKPNWKDYFAYLSQKNIFKIYLV